MHSPLAPTGAPDNATTGRPMRRADIEPGKNPAFSPNLYRWMRRYARSAGDAGVVEQVFRVRPDTPAAKILGAGTLMIGYSLNGHPGDTDFSGARLMDVLCNGGGAGRWCYVGIAPDLEMLEGFWARYLKVGRCAIDPMHREAFQGGDRFHEEGDHRTCLWCGAKQTKVRKPRVVIDESWVAA